MDIISHCQNLDSHETAPQGFRFPPFSPLYRSLAVEKDVTTQNLRVFLPQRRLPIANCGQKKKNDNRFSVGTQVSEISKLLFPAIVIQLQAQLLAIRALLSAAKPIESWRKSWNLGILPVPPALPSSSVLLLPPLLLIAVVTDEHLEP